MSFANALSVLRPTLPYYLALTKYSLLRLTDHSFEFHPHQAAPPIALEMDVQRPRAAQHMPGLRLRRSRGGEQLLQTWDRRSARASRRGRV
jgi:hypothetical protein